MHPAAVAQYEIVRELGRGGMGQVFLARDRELDRLVALKFRHKSGEEDADAKARFRREARALAALNDAGIVTIFEIGEDTAGEFIAMEFVDGSNLRETVGAGLSLDELLKAGADIARSLHIAHEAGVLHRDVKPENIMVSSSGTVKVVDFGIARKLDDAVVDKALSKISDHEEIFAETLPVPAATSNERTHSRVFGTPSYMAPELLYGAEASPASDVYALGIVLYELIAEAQPYGGQSVAEKISAILDPKIVPPTLLSLSRAERPLSLLIESMMAPKADDRPSMPEVRKRLLNLATLPDDDAREWTEPKTHFLRRWSIAIAIAIAGIAALIAARSLPGSGETTVTSGHAVAPTQADPPAEVERAPLIAFSPIVTRVGNVTGESNALAELIASCLRHGDAFRVAVPERLLDKIAPAEPADPAWTTAAAALEARYMVSAILREDSGTYVLEAEVKNLETGNAVKIESHSEANQIDRLIVESAKAIAKVAGETLGELRPMGFHALSDLQDYERGLAAMHARDWVTACDEFQKTVQAAPELFEAWYRLAHALNWRGADPTESIAAVLRAEELAQSTRDAQLMRGLHHFQLGQYAQAIEVLEPLRESHPGDRDIDYHYAESVYHDGAHGEGIALLEDLLETSPRFALAAGHPFQRSLIRRDELKARRLLPVLKRRDGDSRWESDLAFALGNYESLADANSGDYSLRAQIVLRRDEAAGPRIGQEQPNPSAALIERMAWAASGHGDEEVSELHAQYIERLRSGDADANNEYFLLQLAEVLVSAGHKAELQQLLEHWPIKKTDARSHEYLKARLHAAPILGDASLAANDVPSSRLRKISEAIGAEMRGDLENALTIWRELVDDSHHYYSYMERAALLRVLRALGDEEALRATCQDLERPAVYRFAYMTTRCPPEGP